MYNYDAIIVGSGIAGLSAALGLAAKGRSVGLLTKKDKAESNTNHAQGGIASVTSKSDDFEIHVRDTLEAGDGLCDERAVREIVREGPERVRELSDIGVRFSQLRDGRISLGKEGGHSKRRVLHVKDFTGRAIEEALLRAAAAQPNIRVLEHFFAIDLITTRKLMRGGENRIAGLYAYNTAANRVETFRTPAVLLASGGAGQVYLYTTNPSIATGDGVAMAYRAGVEIRNLEFIQFHPTTLYTSTEERFLISEAVRGEGAVLRNQRGKTFMERCHERADLAPRDIVARAIDNEMKMSGARHVWLDITRHSRDFLRERFPSIWEACARQGIDMAKDYVPVVPAAHYLCGGVKTGLRGETDLPGLYACGETACTGLHGANRLASNSLLEAVVLARRAAAALDQYLAGHGPVKLDLPEWADGDMQDSDERVVLIHNWDELKRAMWDYVGIVRTAKRLERARARIQTLAQEIHDYYWNFKVETRLLELRNLVLVAGLIVECALQRRESRGLHHILDYPGKRPRARDTSARRLV